MQKKNNKFVKMLIAFIILLSTLLLLNNISYAVQKYGESYTIDDKYITNILPETTVADLKNNIDDQTVEVYKDNKKLENSNLVGTGMKLQQNGKEYILAVLGDITGNGKIGITDLVKVRLNLVNMEKLENEYAKAGDVNGNGKITITDLTRINLALVNIADMIAPITFTPEVETTKTTIKVKGESIDTNSGIKGYWFEIDNNGWVSNTNKIENEYTFSNLTNNTEHTVRMKVEDNEGNVRVTKRIKVRTLNSENSNIEIWQSTEQVTNKNVTVAVYYNSNIAEKTMQISLDEGTTWEEYTGPVAIEKNQIVMARIINNDGTVIEEQQKSITNIDKLPPKDFNITATGTTNEITVRAHTTDADRTSDYACSGLKEYKYILMNGFWSWEYTGTEEEHTFTNLMQGIEYKLKVIAIDNAGNEKESNNGTDTVIKTDKDYPTLLSMNPSIGDRVNLPIKMRKEMIDGNGPMQYSNEPYFDWFILDKTDSTITLAAKGRKLTLCMRDNYAVWRNLIEGACSNYSLSGYTSGDSTYITKDDALEIGPERLSFLVGRDTYRGTDTYWVVTNESEEVQSYWISTGFYGNHGAADDERTCNFVVKINLLPDVRTSGYVDGAWQLVDPNSN